MTVESIETPSSGYRIVTFKDVDVESGRILAHAHLLQADCSVIPDIPLIVQDLEKLIVKDFGILNDKELTHKHMKLVKMVTIIANELKANAKGICKDFEMELVDNDKRVTNLLQAFHKFNILTEAMVTIISDELKINAKDICNKEGITYTRGRNFGAYKI
jgi:hypothetical protein